MAVYFCDQGATGANNGTSWTDAYTSLNGAITAITGGAGHDLLVDDATITLSATIAVNKSLNIYGGCVGTESVPGDRVAGAKTILDGYNGGSNVNCVTITNAAQTDEFVGFEIINGVSASLRIASGLTVTSPVTAKEIDVHDCVGSGEGTGGVNVGEIESPDGAIFEDVDIYDNVSDDLGGGLDVGSGTHTFNRIKIRDNSLAIGADGWGGGLMVETNAVCTFTNFQITGNHADLGGGIYIGNGSTATVRFVNGTISDNLGDGADPCAQGGAVYSESSTVDADFVNVSSWGNSYDSDEFYDASGNVSFDSCSNDTDSNPLYIGSGDDPYDIQATSPLIGGANTLDADYPSTDMLDRARSSGDIGAYEYTSGAGGISLEGDAESASSSDGSLGVSSPPGTQVLEGTVPSVSSATTSATMTIGMSATAPSVSTSDGNLTTGDFFAIVQTWETVTAAPGTLLHLGDGDPPVPYFEGTDYPSVNEHQCFVSDFSRAGTRAVEQRFEGYQGEGAVTAAYRMDQMWAGEEVWAGQWMYFPSDFEFRPTGTWSGKALWLAPWHGDGRIIINSYPNDGTDGGPQFFIQFQSYSAQGSGNPTNGLWDAGTSFSPNFNAHPEWYDWNPLRGRWVWYELYVYSHPDINTGFARAWVDGNLLFEGNNITFDTSQTTGSTSFYTGNTLDAGYHLLPNIAMDGVPGGQSAFVDECIITNDPDVVTSLDADGNRMIGPYNESGFIDLFAGTLSVSTASSDMSVVGNPNMVGIASSVSTISGVLAVDNVTGAPSPGVNDTIVFEEDWEDGNYDRWTINGPEVAAGKLTITSDLANVRTGSYAMEVEFSPATLFDYGEINVSYVDDNIAEPGYDELYHRWYTKSSAGFDCDRGDGNTIHFYDMAGGRRNNHLSSDGSGVPANGTNKFELILDSYPDWHTGPTTIDNVGFIPYVYHMDQLDQWGQHFDQNVDVPPIANITTDWQEIVVYMKLNTPTPTGAYDGILRIWYDGVLKYEKIDFRFRSEPADPDEILELNRFRIVMYAVDIPIPQYQWIDDITIWAPGNDIVLAGDSSSVSAATCELSGTNAVDFDGVSTSQSTASANIGITIGMEGTSSSASTSTATMDTLALISASLQSVSSASCDLFVGGEQILEASATSASSSVAAINKPSDLLATCGSASSGVSDMHLNNTWEFVGTLASVSDAVGVISKPTDLVAESSSTSSASALLLKPTDIGAAAESTSTSTADMLSIVGMVATSQSVSGSTSNMDTGAEFLLDGLMSSTSSATAHLSLPLMQIAAEAASVSSATGAIRQTVTMAATAGSTSTIAGALVSENITYQQRTDIEPFTFYI